MATKKQIQAEVKKAILIFQQHMPGADFSGMGIEIYPETSFWERCESLIRMLHAGEDTYIICESETCAALLHGTSRDVLLIRMEYVPDFKSEMEEEEIFLFILWKALSQSYIYQTTCAGDLYERHALSLEGAAEYLTRELDEFWEAGEEEHEKKKHSSLLFFPGQSRETLIPQEVRDLYIQDGSFFWVEFISHCIATNIDGKYYGYSKEELTALDKELPYPKNWHSMRDMLHKQLSNALYEKVDLDLDQLYNGGNGHENTFSSSENTNGFDLRLDALAVYYASILTEEICLRYIRAAENGKLFDYICDSRGKHRKTLSEEEADITGIYSHEALKNELLVIKLMLQKQLEKESYWDVEKEWICDLGREIILLGLLKGLAGMQEV